MTGQEFPGDQRSQAVSLVVRRTIRATPQRLFDAWTQPAHLKRWWGPAPVRCVDAEIDLRVGGRYRIANQFPDGRLLWITGEFELVEPPYRLVYSWRTESGSQKSERVTILFKPQNDATEVIVVHERIPDEAVRRTHELGWVGCLDGLAKYVNGQKDR